VELSDHGATLAVKANGVIDSPGSEAMVHMSSSALAFVLRNRFGASTVLIDGRFERLSDSPRDPFVRLVALRDANNEGQSIGTVVWRRLVRRLEQRARPGGSVERWLALHRRGLRVRRDVAAS
jgi:hypothetical protein